MIKRITDLSLRLADLVEAEGRVARAHALRFLAAGLMFAVAAVVVACSLCVFGTAAVLGLTDAGLSWPAALLIAGAGGLIVAASLVVGGRLVLRDGRPARSPRASVPAVPVGTENNALKGAA
ncbi:MAG: hypothetical protein HKO59_14510 [Phycisphaerales bacterium]|nr:hypothetical protein [Phycisphaerales bacterium]NNM27173.1 hypothetical protein [Phycisphaerales bacterium]